MQADSQVRKYHAIHREIYDWIFKTWIQNKTIYMSKHNSGGMQTWFQEAFLSRESAIEITIDFNVMHYVLKVWYHYWGGVGSINPSHFPTQNIQYSHLWSCKLKWENHWYANKIWKEIHTEAHISFFYASGESCHLSHLHDIQINLNLLFLQFSCMLKLVLKNTQDIKHVCKTYLITLVYIQWIHFKFLSGWSTKLQTTVKFNIDENRIPKRNIYFRLFFTREKKAGK